MTCPATACEVTIHGDIKISIFLLLLLLLLVLGLLGWMAVNMKGSF